MSPSCDTKASAATEVNGIPIKTEGVAAAHGSVKGSSEVSKLSDKFYEDHYLSDAAKARKPSPIRSLFPLESRPGMISLLAGKPNPETYPFLELSFVSRDPHDHSKSSRYTVDPDTLTESLQYGPTSGLPRFASWLTELQEREHGRSSQDERWKISIGTGSQDMVNKAFVAIVNPGDVILIERPVYAAVIPLIESLGAILIDVPTDGDGLRPDSLRKILEEWPSDRPKPKALYTIPYGGNPSGTTAPETRRIEVLALARQYNFLIFEDDPYYHLYYGEAQRPASYFTLEKRLSSPTEPLGRVLRFDSLSKILSAGMRIGFVTGPLAILQAIDRHTSTANLQTSTISQAVALTLLEQWGYEGFKAHTEYVSNFYRKKRDELERALKLHLEGLVEWVTPCAGMFVWFKLLLQDPKTQSSSGETDVGDSEDVIRRNAVEKGVLALPGTVFFSSGEVTPYVRVSFSLVSEELMNEAMRRLREALLEVRAQT